MKTIYIFEYTYQDFDVSNNDKSGTQFRNNFIIENYKDNYNIVYCSNSKIYDSQNKFNNVKLLDNLDYNKPLDVVELLKNEKIDLIISSSSHLDNLMIELYYNKICDNFLLIDNFWPYDIYHASEEDYEEKYVFKEIYKKIIFVNKFDNPYKEKCVNIQNPYWPDRQSYENLQVTEKDKSIIFAFSPFRTDFKYFLNEIYPLIIEKIPDMKFKFCTPNYNNIDNYSDELKEFFKKNENFIFLGSLNQNELINELLKTPCSYRVYDYNESCGTGIYTELLCYCFPVCDFKDGMRLNCTWNFYDKYKVKQPRHIKNVEWFYYDLKGDKGEKLEEYNKSIAPEIANRIIDVVLNYDNYKEDLIKEHNYILENFSPDIKLKEYKKVIDELLV